LCPEQGVYLAGDRAREAERDAPTGHRIRGASLLAPLLDDHGELRPLAPDGRRHPRLGVESVQHHIGSVHKHAPLPAHKGAVRWVTAGPGAEGDVEPRVPEQGEVRDRQGRPPVLDQ